MSSTIPPNTDNGDQLSLLGDDGQPHPDAYTGADLALENSDAWWRACAMAAINQLAGCGVDFTAEDLRDLGVPEPDQPNRWGAVFLAASRSGAIEAVGARRATRGARNASLLRVWRGVAA